MRKTYTQGLFTGFAVTALLFVVAWFLFRPPAKPPEEPKREPVDQQEIEGYKAEIEQLRRKNAELSMLNESMRMAENSTGAQLKAPLPELEPAPAKADDLTTLKTLLSELAGKKLMAMQDSRFREAADLAKKIGEPAVAELAAVLANSKNTWERFLAAGLLEATGDAAAIPHLEKALMGDTDDLVRRFASHGLAMIGTDAAKPGLTHGMTNDKDWGVRVNSAYGLAKMKDEAGLQTLLDYYRSEDPTVKPYRIAILSGLSDIAAPSTAPMFRDMLKQKDHALQLFAVNALEKMKDKDALSALAELISSDATDSIKEQAKKAYNTISGEEAYR